MKKCIAKKSEQETCQVEKMGCKGCYYYKEGRNKEMYHLNTALSSELKGGKTTKYISDKIGVTPGFISTIFSGKRNCTKMICKMLISMRYNISIDDEKMDDFLEKFFKKVLTQ